jgi:8-oxo-dGTP diphosphatase
MPETSFSASILHPLEVRVVIFSLRQRKLQVLLFPSRRHGNPDQWELPGAPADAASSLETTASQCLAPFIGNKDVYLEQLYTYGEPERDPAQRTVSVVYFALLPADTSQTHSKDESGAKWFPVDDLPGLTLDFGDILAYALRRLRYKLEYSAVGFQLMPENFTLSELQSTYELILGEKLDKRNFRRRILQANVIEQTPGYRGGEGRPARLFRYRPDAVAEVKARRLFP